MDPQSLPRYDPAQSYEWNYAHAPDPVLDSVLRRPEVWDPSMFDGDASFE